MPPSTSVALRSARRRLRHTPVVALAPAAYWRHDTDVAKPAVDISNLTADEKLDLIDELWGSFKPEDLPLTPELRAELDRRLDRLDREGPTGVPWDQVRAR